MTVLTGINTHEARPRSHQATQVQTTLPARPGLDQPPRGPDHLTGTLSPPEQNQPEPRTRPNRTRRCLSPPGQNRSPPCLAPAQQRSGPVSARSGPPGPAAQRSPSRLRPGALAANCRRCHQRTADSDPCPSRELKNHRPSPSRTGSRWSRRNRASDQFSALAEALERFGEDGLAVRVAATFLHVSQMRLVRLGTRRGGRTLLVLPAGKPAPRAIPFFGDLRVHRERRAGFVPVRTPIGHPAPWRRFTPLRFARRTGTHAGAANRVTANHESSPVGIGGAPPNRHADRKSPSGDPVIP